MYGSFFHFFGAVFSRKIFPFLLSAASRQPPPCLRLLREKQNFSLPRRTFLLPSAGDSGYNNLIRAAQFSIALPK